MRKGSDHKSKSRTDRKYEKLGPKRQVSTPKSFKSTAKLPREVIARSPLLGLEPGPNYTAYDVVVGI